MRRIQQAEAMLKKELAPMIEEELDEKYGLTTLVGVEIQNDLKEATVFVSCLDRSSQKEVIATLNCRASEFQHILGRKLRWKFTPKINFAADRGLENVAKVQELLAQIGRPKQNKKGHQ